MKTLLVTALAGSFAVGAAMAQSDAQGRTQGQAGAAAGASAIATLSVSPSDLDIEGIRRLQQALADAGHYDGGIDGVWGSRTEQALRDYQRAQGLDAGVGLTEQTLVSLGLLDILGGVGPRGPAVLGGIGEQLGTPGSVAPEGPGQAGVETGATVDR